MQQQEQLRAAKPYAIETRRHLNIGMLQIMPTFQVPGGLTFDRR